MTDAAPATSGPATLGLNSNSDEFAAIEEIEAEFGVTIDYADAPKWRTVGDLFRSLLVQLPAGETGDPEIWERFARTLSQATDIDPETITPDMRLADEIQAWRGLGTLSAALWLLLIGMALVVVLGAVLLAR
jgi:hypothetical protein